MKRIFGLISCFLSAALMWQSDVAAQTCSSCRGGGASTTGGNSAGVSFHITMGFAQFGQAAGNLRFSSMVPTPVLYSPAALQFDGTAQSNVVTVVTTNISCPSITISYALTNTLTVATNYTYETNDSVVTTNVSYAGAIVTSTNTIYTTNFYATNATILQVQAPQAIADIPTPPTTNGYVINFYYPSQVTGQVAGLDTFSGSPYVTWTITNPAPANLNSLQISQTESGGVIKQWNYSYATNTQVWTVQSLGGVVQKNRNLINLSDSTYQIVNTVQASNGPVVQRVATTYQVFDWGVVPIKVDVGASNAPETTTYSYYDPPQSATGSPATPETVTHPDGSSEYYDAYDPSGSPSDVLSTFGDDADAREVAYDFSTNYVGGSGDGWTVSTNTPRRTITYIGFNEVSRSYTVFPSTDSRIDIQCVTAGADWNAADNLYTTNLFYSSGPNQFALKTVIHPDKTITTYNYQTNSAGTFWTNITATGQADSTFSYVVDGTTNYSVVDLFGNMVLAVSADIKNSVVLSQDTYGSPDNYGRPQQVMHLDGTTEYTSYACCGLDSTTDKDGVVTEYLYDAAKRQTGYTKTFGGTNTITYTNVLDAAGRMLQSIRIGTNGSQIILNQKAYDLAGEVVSETNALGGITTYTRSTNAPTGGLIRTATYPDGGTRTNYYYLDGALKQTLGSAVRPVLYVFGSDSGDQYTITYKLTSGGGSNEWVKIFSDMLGRSYETLYSSESGSPASYNFYNIVGQLTNTIDPDGVSTLYAFNAKGERVYSILDTNQDHIIDFSGSDRITYVFNDVTNDTVGYVRRGQTFVWSASGSPSTNIISTVEQSTDGLKSWNTVWNNGSPITSSNITAYGSSGYRYSTNFAPDGSFTVNTYQYSRLTSTVRKIGGTQISGTTYGYDAHGRQYTMTDARNGTTTYTFNNQDQISSVTTPSPGGGLSSEVTSNYFDTMGRTTSTVQPDSTTKTSAFYPTGDLKLTYGSRIYPVGYGYDAQGRMTKMTNWANFASGSGGRTTTWSWDAYRGFLTGKTYDSGAAGPSYTYTPGGRLASRLWARGTNTTYTYDAGGALASVSYNDGTTPGVTYGYDRRERQTQIVQGGTDTTTLTYNDQGQVLSEAYSGGTLDGISVTNGYDSLLRRTSLVTLKSGVLTSTAYAYDGASRLLSVSDGTNSATYSYLANSPLVSQISFTNSGALRMTTTKTYDYLNRLTAIGSVNASSATLDSHNYVYNYANQRTSVTNVDGTYWAYQYDALGQVTSGIKHWADGSVVAGQQFGYGFDDIGNRTTTSAGGDQWGANLRYANYRVNNLNQYTNRTVPGAVDIIGMATNTATVTVNNQPTYRHGNYYRAQLPLTNSAGPVWQTATNLAVLNVGTNYIIETNVNGNVFLPQTPESFSYDADGNLTNDGRWIYTWDGENRLVSMTNNANVPTGAKMGLAFVYDSKSRRISKSVTTNAVTTTLNFVYDGWNLLASLTSSSLSESFVWGPDLSGSMQGAGGVGGLLFLTLPSVQTAFALYDGNGNVTALANAANSVLSANYEYGLFAEVIRATGSMAKANPFTFSTKYRDAESDLIYYGYRYMDTITGRWSTRDPAIDIGFQVLTSTPEKQEHLNHKQLKAAMAMLAKNPFFLSPNALALRINQTPMRPFSTYVPPNLERSCNDEIGSGQYNNLYSFLYNNSPNMIDPDGNWAAITSITTVCLGYSCQCQGSLFLLIKVKYVFGFWPQDPIWIEPETEFYCESGLNAFLLCALFQSPVTIWLPGDL